MTKAKKKSAKSKPKGKKRKLEPKKFLFMFDNRIGCMIIAFIELLYYGLNFALCATSLNQGLNHYIMRIDYYRKSASDYLAMELAAAGMAIAVISLACSASLFFVALKRGKLKHVIFLYVGKNAATVIADSVFMSIAVSKNQSGDLTTGSTVITMLFGILISMVFAYFTFIAVVYYYEVTEREDIARRLYIAYDIITEGKMAKMKGARKELKKEKKSGRSDKAGPTKK